MFVIAGLAVGALAPRPFSPLRNTRPTSPTLGALGRFAVAVVELPLLAISSLVTTGAVLLTRPSATRSTIEICPPASVFVKSTVRVPEPLALDDVVIQ